MKKAQVWSVDFVVGISLFSILVVITAYFLLTSNTSDDFKFMHREALYLSNTIMSPGTPGDWNSDTVVVPGLISNGRLDLDKLSGARALDYDELKSFYAVRADFAIFFRNKTSFLEVGGACGVGYNLPTIDCEPNLSAVVYDDLIVMNRFVPINNSIKNVVLYVWT